MLKAEGGEMAFHTKDLKGYYSHGLKNESITNCLWCSSETDETAMYFIGTDPADISEYLNWRRNQLEA